MNASAPADDLLGSYVCGGALVAPQIVLTAAHCVAGRRASRIDVVIGADNLCHDAPVEGERMSTSRITSFAGRDLALLQLSEPSRLRPIAVADRAEQAGEELTALGWGRESMDGPSPCTRTAVLLNRTASGACADLFRVAASSESSTWLCAQPVPGQLRNTCVGDSGGPLLAGAGQNLRLVGITSFGRGCEPQSAGVYASSSGLPDLIARSTASS